MKIAICFYGLVGSMEDKNGNGKSLDPKVAFNLNKENLFKNNDVDIFIHSWSIEHKQNLIDLYKPKDFLIEPQIQFEDNEKLLNNTSIYERFHTKIQKIINIDKYRLLRLKRIEEIKRAKSRWLSTKKVLELKKSYEKKEGIKYDIVMLLRLDVGFYTKMNFSILDKNCLHVSNWNDFPNKQNNFIMNKRNNNIGKGFLDFWFIGNSSIIDQFSTVYDDFSRYHINPHRSSYQLAKRKKIPIKFILYRWIDFEMVRRKEFKAIN